MSGCCQLSPNFGFTWVIFLIVPTSGLFHLAAFVNVKPICLIQFLSQSRTEVSVSWQAGSVHWVNASLFCKAELDE